jgi:hypothetical protein
MTKLSPHSDRRRPRNLKARNRGKRRTSSAVAVSGEQPQTACSCGCGCVRGRNAGTRVGHSDVEVTVYRVRRDTNLAGVGELDRVTDEVQEHLGQTLLVAEANSDMHRSAFKGSAG